MPNLQAIETEFKKFESIDSPNGYYRFTFEGNGNLVLYDLVKQTQIWSTGTQGKKSKVLKITKEGQIILYSEDNKILWQRSSKNKYVLKDGDLSPIKNTNEIPNLTFPITTPKTVKIETIVLKLKLLDNGELALLEKTITWSSKLLSGKFMRDKELSNLVSKVWSNSNDKKQVAFTFSGGSSYIAFELGVAMYLVQQKKITPSILTGTSTGALMASILATNNGKNINESNELHSVIDKMVNLLVKGEGRKITGLLDVSQQTKVNVNNIRAEIGNLSEEILSSFVDIDIFNAEKSLQKSIGKKWKKAIDNLGNILGSQNSLFDTTKLRTIVNSLVTNEKIKNSGIKIKVCAVSLNSGKLIIVNQDRKVYEHTFLGDDAYNYDAEFFSQAVMASGSLPVAFPPVLIRDLNGDGRNNNGHICIDGGLRVNIPLEQAVDLNADEAHVIFANQGFKGEKNTALFSMLMPTIDIPVDQNSEGSVEKGILKAEVKGKPLTFKIYRPSVTMYSSLLFSGALSNIAIGYGQMKAADVNDELKFNSSQVNGLLGALINITNVFGASQYYEIADSIFHLRSLNYQLEHYVKIDSESSLYNIMIGEGDINLNITSFLASELGFNESKVKQGVSNSSFLSFDVHQDANYYIEYRNGMANLISKTSLLALRKIKKMIALLLRARFASGGYIPENCWEWVINAEAHYWNFPTLNVWEGFVPISGCIDENPYNYNYEKIDFESLLDITFQNSNAINFVGSGKTSAVNEAGVFNISASQWYENYRELIKKECPALFNVMQRTPVMQQVTEIPDVINKTKPITLLHVKTKKYICAENGGTNNTLIGNRDLAKSWETFQVYFVLADSVLAFKAVNGKFLSANNGGGSNVTCDRTVIDRWEGFMKVTVGSNLFKLRTWNGSFLKCDANGVLNATAKNIDEADVFSINLNEIKYEILNPVFTEVHSW